jgi:hypothetical protein
MLRKKGRKLKYFFVLDLLFTNHAEFIVMGFALHGLPESAHDAFWELPHHCDTNDWLHSLILGLHVVLVPRKHCS